VRRERHPTRSDRFGSAALLRIRSHVPATETFRWHQPGVGRRGPGGRQDVSSGVHDAVVVGRAAAGSEKFEAPDHGASKGFVYLPPHGGLRPAPGSELIPEATGGDHASRWARVAELIGQAVAQGLATAVTTTTLGQSVAVSVSQHQRMTWRKPTSAVPLAGVDPAFRAPTNSVPEDGCYRPPCAAGGGVPVNRPRSGAACG